MYQNPLTNRIVEMLASLAGKTMAESVVGVQAKKMGVDPEQFTAAELPQIAERFAANLKIFVGTEKARQIGDSVRQLA
jgi:hypothetical protein